MVLVASGEGVDKAGIRHGTFPAFPLFASQWLAALLQHVPRLDLCRHRHVYASSRVKHLSGKQ